MSRIMYDAVTAANVPVGATLVAGYGDGYYQNVAAFRSRFPGAIVVEIAVSSRHNLGVVLDVETGDATPAEAPPWVLMRRAAGVDPTVYCNSSTWPAVRAAFQSAGVAEPHYWIAHYDGDPTIPAGAVAKQYADPGPYDLSSVAAYWPGVDTAPLGADMPLSPADLDLLKTQLVPAVAAATVSALLNAQVPDLSLPDGNGGFKTNTFIHEAENAAKFHADEMAAVAALGKQLAGLGTPQLSDAQVQALAGQLAPALLPALTQALVPALLTAMGHKLDGTPAS